jgi:hypothetical protein
MQRNMVITLLVLSLAFLATAGSSPLPAAGPRNLVVFFEFLDNANGVEDAVEFIFNKMLGLGDQLIIQSPARTYGFSQATLSQPKAELIAKMQEKLRGDISKSGQNYKQVIKNLETAVFNIEDFVMSSGAEDSGKGGQPQTSDLSELFILYRQELANLNQLRIVNEKSLRQLSAAFRGQKGENHIIVLFEREFRPVPRREVLNILADMPKFATQSNELFFTSNVKEPFDIAALADYYKQVPLTQHFIYVTAKSNSSSGNLLENSNDIYSTFSKLAEATGGVCTTISEPTAGLQSIMKAWKGTK